VSDEDSKLPEDYHMLYDDFFSLAIASCSNYTGVAVASTMMGIAMRLYKTSLTEEDFASVMTKVLASSTFVRPYTTKDFGMPTLH